MQTNKKDGITSRTLSIANWDLNQGEHDARSQATLFAYESITCNAYLNGEFWSIPCFKAGAFDLTCLHVKILDTPKALKYEAAEWCYCMRSCSIKTLRSYPSRNVCMLTKRPEKFSIIKCWKLLVERKCTCCAKSGQHCSLIRVLPAMLTSTGRFDRCRASKQG